MPGTVSSDLAAGSLSFMACVRSAPDPVHAPPALQGFFLTVRWGVAWSGLLRVLFVIYCVEAGLFLVIAPWREFWNLLVSRSALSQAHLGAFLMLPWVRGAVTGFGLIHLIWGIHDLEGILRRRASGRETAVPAPDRAG